jgi:anthranilate phosphoribosyltransferase
LDSLLEQGPLNIFYSRSLTMQEDVQKTFGQTITNLIQKQDLSRKEAKQAFETILNNQTTDMQQGAFLAALTAKGETRQEVAGSWEAIYELDTTKVSVKTTEPIVENSGTGMDSFKTFNISTIASIIAAAGGIPMARHGARAITSMCGTVDMAELLGIDVECKADVVGKSIEEAGIGLFNGMSPNIHPLALGRILSQIQFGSTLNIAASLANPALPAIGVRGVYSKEMVVPVAQVMKEIGYKNAVVLYGSVGDTGMGMDEASVCGITHAARFFNCGAIEEFSITPESFGMGNHSHTELQPSPDIVSESRRFVALLNNKESGARKEAALLNAGLIFYAAGQSVSIENGIEKAAQMLEKGKAFNTLEKWVTSQNTDPEKGLKKLEQLV